MRISVAFLTAVALQLFSAPPAAASVAADVIVVVDTSGSMTEEANAVRAALNSFAATIQSTPVDLHLILIGTGTVSVNLCIPAPLGSGVCPADDALPVFRHVQQTVSSNDALSRILATYPQWSGSLRPGASTAVIVLSDDDSSMSSSQFDSLFQALNPGLPGYTFHAMAAGSAACGITGMVYAQLANLTGGVFSNLCNEAIDVGLTRIAHEIIGGASPPVLHPGCDIQLNQASFGNGNAVVMQVFRFTNPTAAPQRVEVKIWLEAPGLAPIGLLNAGADGALVFPAGYDVNLGQPTLLTITPQFLRGAYGIHCRFVDPVTGTLKAEDLNPFVVQ